MLVVVPIAQRHRELLVVRVHLLRGVDDEGRTEAVDVLPVGVRVDPVGAPLVGGVDGDLVGEGLAGGDAAVKVEAWWLLVAVIGEGERERRTIERRPWRRRTSWRR